MLGGLLGATHAMMGVAELVVRLDEPGPLLFWLPTLWGASLLITATIFVVRRPALRFGLAAAGVLVGALPTMWTIVVPLAGLVLVVLVAREQPVAAVPGPG